MSKLVADSELTLKGTRVSEAEIFDQRIGPEHFYVLS
jgi:hypothetical protein